MTLALSSSVRTEVGITPLTLKLTGGGFRRTGAGAVLLELLLVAANAPLLTSAIGTRTVANREEAFFERFDAPGTPEH